MNRQWRIVGLWFERQMIPAPRSRLLVELFAYPARTVKPSSTAVLPVSTVIT